MYVYFIRSNSRPPMLKIGRSDDPIHRMAELQVGSPFELEMVGTVKCRSHAHSVEMETTAHKLFRGSAYRGEWFRYDQKLQDYVAALLKGDADSMRHNIHALKVDRWFERQERKRAAKEARRLARESRP